MTDALTRLLATRDWLLADGATGTNLFNMGLTSGDAPEMWNVDHPDKIRALYQGAVDAGSDIFLTNSFGGNASRLKLHGAEDRVRELNRVAAEIGREVADKAGRTVIVAGSVGPTGEIMEPMGTLTYRPRRRDVPRTGRGAEGGRRRRALGRDDFGRRGIPRRRRGLCAGRDALVRHHELRHRRAHDDGPDLGRDGQDGRRSWHNQPLAFGANCGVGASDLLRTILGFAAAGPELPIIAKGNAGIPKYHDGHIHYDGTPELMADYAVLARDAAPRSSAAAAAPRPSICGDARRAGDPPARRAPDARADHRGAGRVFLGLGRHGRRTGGLEPARAAAGGAASGSNSDSCGPARPGTRNRSVRRGGRSSR